MYVFQAMSHINDLIGVMRGLRLVVEAGLKVQQESTRVIWNNSSIKTLIQNCSPNTLTAYNPKPEDAKDLLERALVVAHGFRQYAVMHVPNFNEAEKATEMDKELREEIDELNREFNKTFETLKKTENVKASVAPKEVKQVREEYVAPLENLQSATVQRSVPPVVEMLIPPVPPVAEVKMPKPVESASSSSSAAPGVPKPIAKKKIRVSVSLFFNRKLLNIFHKVHLLSFSPPSYPNMCPLLAKL